MWLGWGNSTNPEIFKVARIVPTVSVGCLTVLNTYTTYTYRLDGKLVKYRAWGYFFDAQSLEATWTGQPDRLYTLSYCTVFSDRRRNPLPFLVVYCVVMYMNIYERRTSVSLYHLDRHYSSNSSSAITYLPIFHLSNRSLWMSCWLQLPHFLYLFDFLLDWLE